MATLERTGILVIRAWLELGGEAGLRARITTRLDASAGQPLETAVASEAEVVAAVREWLNAFLDAPVTRR